MKKQNKIYFQLYGLGILVLAFTSTSLADQTNTIESLATPYGTSGMLTLIITLFSAFIGGLILNLMPCVFPVISIKLLGFVKQAHGDSNRSAQHGVAFALGVLISFWILASILIILRASGAQIGWGFQLQSPEILSFLSCLFFLLGLNLLGVFEMGLSFMSTGSTLTNQAGLWGSFFSGFLATLVATPCTAPLMGTALGYTLTQPPWISFLVFTMLGLGMASPYVILSRYTQLMKWIPKPGPWMETLKHIMGFLLMATVLWLVLVLNLQTGSAGILSLLVGLLIISIGAWVLGQWGSIAKGPSIRRKAFFIAVLLIGAGVGHAVYHTPKSTPPPVIPTGSKTMWAPFSPEKVAELQAQNIPVFIDFTAAWCLTCQANKKAVLQRSHVEKKFNELGVVTMRADWTQPDETITKALAAFGRNSVPLYVLYGRDPRQKPVILPELLTSKIVIEALEKLRFEYF